MKIIEWQNPGDVVVWYKGLVRRSPVRTDAIQTAIVPLNYVLRAFHLIAYRLCKTWPMPVWTKAERRAWDQLSTGRIADLEFLCEHYRQRCWFERERAAKLESENQTLRIALMPPATQPEKQ